MRKNGFTLIEMLAVLVILGILSVVAIAGTMKYLEQAKKQTMNDYEVSMYNAARNYLIKNTGKIPNSGSTNYINLATLIDSGYIKALKDPYNKSENCNESLSKVTITNNGDVGVNADLVYTVFLKCSKEETKIYP